MTLANARQSDLSLDRRSFLRGAGSGLVVCFTLAAQTRDARAAGGMLDRKSTRLNSSHIPLSRMPSSA